MALQLTPQELENTRVVTMLGKQTRVRKLPPSSEALRGLGLLSKRTIVSHLSINPPEIERAIRSLKAKILREMALMASVERERFINEGPIDFVKDKGDRKKYTITCTRCGEKVATVWAMNDKLDDWCDLHYICWYNKHSWFGALTINVSPIDGQIGVECACGEDTRDFRNNHTLAPIQKQLMIEYTQRHRDFGKTTSRFIAVAGTI